MTLVSFKKTVVITICLIASTLMLSINADNQCNIDFYSSDTTKWSEITKGLMFGLYKNPPANVSLCP